MEVDMKYTVIASRGNFDSIEDAAFKEKDINWWDDSERERQRVCTVAYAATELAKFLPGGCRIAADDEDVGESGTVILLGKGNENAYVKRLEAELEKRLTIGENVAKNSYRMLGFVSNGVNYVILSGSDRVGTLYAAYAYLERLGVHFIEPGEPHLTEPDETPEFDITESPSFKVRGAMSSFIDGDLHFLEWLARNRFNSLTLKRDGHPYHTQKKLGLDSVEGGHKIFYTFIQPSDEYPYRHEIYGGEGKPRDPYRISKLCRPASGKDGVFTYGDAHPEWYALIDGVRRMRRFPEDFKRRGGAPGDNICTGNEDATHELCAQIIEALADGPWKYADHLNLWPIDNGAWCECESCKAQGSYSRRILLLAYKLDKYIKKAVAEGKLNREIHLICPAYHETLEIPDMPLPEDFDYSTCSVVFYPIERCYLHDIDDPICTETNAVLLGNLLPWTKKLTYKGELVIGEYYNVSTFAAMPFVLTKRMEHEIPLYYSLGARQLHYMHMTARDWGFIALNNYLHAKLMWNINASVEEIKETYFEARYGRKLAGKMRELYERLETVTANCKFYKHYQYFKGKRASLFQHLESSGEITEETLFPTAHMKLDHRADDAQAGPSLKETLDGLRLAAHTLSEIISECKDKAARASLLYDKRRLDFGVKMTEFLYLMCLCSIGRSENLEALRKLARELESDTESMRGYDFGDTFKNALSASWIKGTYYKRFSEDAGAGSDSDGIAL